MINIIDFGIEDYGNVLLKQRTLFDALVEAKRNGIQGTEYILAGEHLPVITLGRRAQESNILFPKDFLEEKGIKVFHIERGGDVTFHNPGQLIIYPIIDLDKHNLGVKDFVNLMEEAVIRTLKFYGIKGERIEGKTGVWIGKGTSFERKICAMGIKCTRFCTMHGLSLNVNNDLEGFTWINPCGFRDRGVTSIKKESGKEFKISDVKERLLHIFFGLVFPLQEVFDFPEEL